MACENSLGKCFICEKRDDRPVTQVKTLKGFDSLKESSIHREDGFLPFLQSGQKVYVHEDLQESDELEERAAVGFNFENTFFICNKNAVKTKNDRQRKISRRNISSVRRYQKYYNEKNC